MKFRDKSTMLIFKTGKFRIMGGVDDLDAHFNIFSVTSLHHHNYPNIVLQTLTAAYSYTFNINLDKLSREVQCCYYNPESFPAVQIRQFKPIHVNVFASGKVTITGLKDIERAREIEDLLDRYMCCIHPNNVF